MDPIRTQSVKDVGDADVGKQNLSYLNKTTIFSQLSISLDSVDYVLYTSV